MARAGVPLNVIQCQLGPSNLGITAVDLQGSDNSEIIDTVHAQSAPMLPAGAERRCPWARIAIAPPRTRRLLLAAKAVVVDRTAIHETPRPSNRSVVV